MFVAYQQAGHYIPLTGDPLFRSVGHSVFKDPTPRLAGHVQNTGPLKQIHIIFLGLQGFEP